MCLGQSYRFLHRNDLSVNLMIRNVSSHTNLVSDRFSDSYFLTMMLILRLSRAKSIFVARVDSTEKTGQFSATMFLSALF